MLSFGQVNLLGRQFWATGRLNLLGGQINLLGGQMPAQLTCYLPPCAIHMGCSEWHSERLRRPGQEVNMATRCKEIKSPCDRFNVPPHPQHKLIGCHRIDTMTLIRVDDMYDVSPLRKGTRTFVQ